MSSNSKLLFVSFSCSASPCRQRCGCLISVLILNPKCVISADKMAADENYLHASSQVSSPAARCLRQKSCLNGIKHTIQEIILFPLRHQGKYFLFIAMWVLHRSKRLGRYPRCYRYFLLLWLKSIHSWVLRCSRKCLESRNLGRFCLIRGRSHTCAAPDVWLDQQPGGNTFPLLNAELDGFYRIKLRKSQSFCPE